VYRACQRRHIHCARTSTSSCTCSVADRPELQRLGMLKNSEEFGKISPDEVRDSPISDTSAPSTDADISELLTITGTAKVSTNVNSSESLPSTKKFKPKVLATEHQELEKVKSHTGEDLTVFSSSEISVCRSDTTAVSKEAEATKSPESSFKRKQQSSDTKQRNELAVSSDDLGVIDSAFEPDETSQKNENVQIQVASSKRPVARYNQNKTEWNVFKSRSLAVLLVGFILWAAIFFPLLLNGIM